jgi:hypothetical protein
MVTPKGEERGGKKANPRKGREESEPRRLHPEGLTVRDSPKRGPNLKTRRGGGKKERKKGRPNERS